MFTFNYRWEFKTKNYDVAFGVFRVCEGQKIPVVPIVRVHSHVIAEDGSLVCGETGTCKYNYSFFN